MHIIRFFSLSSILNGGGGVGKGFGDLVKGRVLIVSQG